MPDTAPRPDALPPPYTTALAPDKEATFQKWVTTNNVPWKDEPRADYDMRGYWQDVASKGQDARQRNASDQKMHFPDTYKTPYHATFSNESKYATPDAPKWQGDKLIAKDGTVVADETPKPTSLFRSRNSWRIPTNDHVKGVVR
jgi:hypothetical protein